VWGRRGILTQKPYIVFRILRGAGTCFLQVLTPLKGKGGVFGLDDLFFFGRIFIRGGRGQKADFGKRGLWDEFL
jgi:hypothetical protein